MYWGAGYVNISESLDQFLCPEQSRFSEQTFKPDTSLSSEYQSSFQANKNRIFKNYSYNRTAVSSPLCDLSESNFTLACTPGSFWFLSSFSNFDLLAHKE